jgi:hypothetical protein
MCPHVDPAEIERIPLQEHVEELRRRCEAVGRLQGGATYFEEELQIFAGYAAEQGLLLTAGPPELTQAPSAKGNEHQVWFLEQPGIRRFFTDNGWRPFTAGKIWRSSIRQKTACRSARHSVSIP